MAIRDIKITKRRIVLGILALVFALLAIVFALWSRQITGALQSQHAAERWAADNRQMAQISAFLPEHHGLSQPALNRVLSTIRRNLTDEGFAPDDGDWAFAYSADTVLRVHAEGNSSMAHVSGVGGNFFLFHNVLLISGAYFSGDAINRDLVMLEESLAWHLFGAIDVAGFELQIDGKPFIVSGVFRPAGDFANRAAHGEFPRMFMLYDAMLTQMPGAPITAIQFVLPNPIRNMAEDMVGEALESEGVPEDEYLLINNSTRFSFSARWRIIWQFGQRSMYQMGLSLPDWENAARMAEDFAALYLFLSLFFSLWPILYALWIIRLLWKHKSWSARTVWQKADNVREQKRESEWYAKNPNYKRQAPPEIKRKTRQQAKRRRGWKHPTLVSGADNEPCANINYTVEDIVREVLEEQNEQENK